MSNIILEIKLSDYLSLFWKTTIEKQYQLIFLFEYERKTEKMILKIFNKNETRFFFSFIALFIVYLWTLPLEPAVSSLIVPPNGLIYSRVDYAKKQLNQICRFCRLFYVLSLLTLFAYKINSDKRKPQAFLHS